MSRLCVTIVASALCACAFAGAAGANLNVALSSAGRLTVTVPFVPTSTTDGDHFFVIEPFKDPTRDGFRVTLVVPPFSGPDISTADSDCFRSLPPFAPDVVCNGPRGSVGVTGGRGADDVIVFDNPGGGAASRDCREVPPPVGTYDLNLGGGADRLRPGNDENLCSSGQFPVAAFDATFEANGGAGDDQLTGGDRRDDLIGGPGVDVIQGGGGNDSLRGTGDGDTLAGGDGIADTVSYSGGDTPTLVTIGADANDGPVPGTDNVAGDVENAVGSNSNDVLIGNASANTLEGVAGRDRLEGAGGDDVLRGSLGNDTLIGNAGSDTLLGEDNDDTLFGGTSKDFFVAGSGDDSLDARDGVFDEISCGPGVDFASGDLADFFVRFTIAGVTRSFRNSNGSDCENIDTMAIDDGLPGHAVGRSLRRAADGRTTVTVACPRRARIACRGELTVRLRRANGRVVGRTRYAARVGKRTAVPVSLGSARRGATVFVHTVERGVSKKGPRRSVRLLRIR